MTLSDAEKWQQIRALDKERMEIERRIMIRAAIHHASATYRDPETGKRRSVDKGLLHGYYAATDGERYIKIQDLQWQILLGKDIDPDNSHEATPE